MVIYKKHSLAIRWIHWINFPLVMLMILSGIMIYWANRVYTPFIPNDFYEYIGISQRLSLGMGLHFFFMWFFALNGVAYVLYLIFSGEWRELVPNLKNFKDAILVTLHDLGLKKTLPMQSKFNGAQKIAYCSVLLMGILQIMTG
ncbi:MAG: cytochrome b/b6 domain-containing protein, partial [Bdellovibrionaceae bacterium]|nr:cytochrome b/b6 domain-containing protein [Pseudobdellovibrionaceae bacterium]